MKKANGSHRDSWPFFMFRRHSLIRSCFRYAFWFVQSLVCAVFDILPLNNNHIPDWFHSSNKLSKEAKNCIAALRGIIGFLEKLLKLIDFFFRCGISNSKLSCYAVFENFPRANVDVVRFFLHYNVPPYGSEVAFALVACFVLS